MASTSNSSFNDNNSAVIEQFCSVTGANKETAVRMLEICNWNLEMAVNMHVDSDYPENSCNSAIDNANLPAENAEEIRAPIPQSRGILVDEDYGFYFDNRVRKRRPHSIFDGFRDFQAEARWQELTASGAAESTEAYKKRRTLEDLFRPPLDIMHRGSFESARESGQVSNRWLMVNVQDSQEFSCQILNRDVWSNKAVKNYIIKHFIFWQVYSDSSDGQRYMQFYKPVEFPYVAVIDPRTGENLIVWHEIDMSNFFELIEKFLQAHSLPNGSAPNSNASSASNSLLDQSEEYQVKAALEASMKEATVVNVEDNDSDFETFDSDSESPKSKPSKISHVNSENSNDTIDVVGLSESKDNSEAKSNLTWKAYLGDVADLKSDLVLRFPDGKKTQVTWPCSTKVKCLLLYIEELGYDAQKYELVTNFPRRNLCLLDLNKTLKEVDLYPREMIFVQLKT